MNSTIEFSSFCVYAFVGALILAVSMAKFNRNKDEFFAKYKETIACVKKRIRSDLFLLEFEHKCSAAIDMKRNIKNTYLVKRENYM